MERKSRLTIVKRLNGRDSQSMKHAVVELAHQLDGRAPIRKEDRSFFYYIILILAKLLIVENTIAKRD